MKKVIVKVFAMIFFCLAVSCGEDRTSALPVVNATVCFSGELAEITQAKVLVFDETGYFEKFASCAMPGQTAGVVGSFEIEAGVHTIAAFMNGENYDISPSVPDVGSTHISEITAKQKKGTNDVLWVGQVKADFQPGNEQSLTISLIKASGVEFNVDILPWTSREIEAEL